jgi:integrase
MFRKDDFMQYNITYREKDKGIQFIISYKDNNGKWKQKSKQGFSGKAVAKIAADKMLDELKKDIALQSKLNSEYGNFTFKEYALGFIEHQKLYKEYNTIEHYKTTFNAFASLYNLKIMDIKTSNVQKCVDTLVIKGYKETSIKGFLSSLHYVFNYALKKDKVVIENPVQDIDFKIEKSKKEKTALTFAQTRDLLSKIENKQLHLITMIAVKCGLRIGEILGLTWDNIDFKNSLLTVNKQWKKDKKGAYGFGDVKGKNSNRIVPIPKDLIQELKNYRTEQKIISLNDRIVKYDSRNIISATLCRVYKKAGYKISVHELRHTYATALISNGLDFKTASNLLGHDISQTMNTYSHVTDDMINRAKKLIDKIL